MPQYPELKLYDAGEWRRGEGQPVINPADETVLGTVPHATRSDLDDALEAPLQPIYDRFTEGFETADLRAAKALLDALG